MRVHLNVFVRLLTYYLLGTRNFSHLSHTLYVATCSLLLSVTGAARNFSLPTRLQRMITAGLQRATGSTDAWVITGGTHAGVMKVRAGMTLFLQRHRIRGRTSVASEAGESRLWKTKKKKVDCSQRNEQRYGQISNYNGTPFLPTASLLVFGICANFTSNSPDPLINNSSLVRL